MKNIIIVGVVILGAAGVVVFYNSRQTKPPLSNVNPTEQAMVLSPTKAKVPLPQESDIIRTFFELINEKKLADAVSMMSVEDNSEKQAWAVQFNAFDSVKVLGAEPSAKEEWTETKHKYTVAVDVKMNSSSANAPIPYYGWENGENIRWISVEKIEGAWKIAEIATGP